MHPAQASLGGVGRSRVWWLRLVQSVWMRRGSAVPAVPGTGTVIMVIVVLPGHRHRALGEDPRLPSAPGLTLNGEVSWSTSGPLRIAGTLVASMKGEDLTATVAGSYTNASAWSFEAALRSPTGVRVGGLFTLSTLEGSVTARSAATVPATAPRSLTARYLDSLASKPDATPRQNEPTRKAAAPCASSRADRAPECNRPPPTAGDRRPPPGIELSPGAGTR